MKRVHFESLRVRRWCAAASGVALVAVAACAGPGATENFFALNDGGVVQFATASDSGVATQQRSLPGILVSAVTVPEMIDRPQIVTRDSANRVVVSEQNLWAEPIKSGVARTLAARLARALADAGRPTQVGAYPQTAIVDPYLRVTVDIVRFDAVPNGEAVVDALWSVRRTADSVVRTGRTVASAPIAGTGYDAIVTGWNDALRIVDQDIATMVEQIGASEPAARPAN